MALPDVARRTELVGSPLPRIAPPTPLRSLADELVAEAVCLGVTFLPWQLTAASYLDALGPGDAWAYPEVAAIVGRQNGKTEILVPHIARRLRQGRRIMHTAQNRELPREVFGRVAEHMMAKHAGELASRPRFANGQEEIRLRNGGRYRIVAPTRGGARGPSNDDLIIDELREMEDHDFIAAAKPTLSASPNPQVFYLSNAGTEASAVLNALRKRVEESDNTLAYLEWSAGPDRTADDPAGWAESNPAIGHLPGKYANVEREYRANLLGGTMDIFEVEYLCRSQVSVAVRLVKPDDWAAQDFTVAQAPLRRVMAVNMDISGSRASAVLAWAEGDGTEQRVSLDVVAEVTGSPIDVNRLGPDIQKLAQSLRASTVGYDPYTDADLARHLRRAKAIRGKDFSDATAAFERLVRGRKFRIHDEAGVIAADLAHTTKRAGPFGSFMAVGSSEEHSTTAVQAAVRAAWLASNPVPTGGARIW